MFKKKSIEIKVSKETECLSIEKIRQAFNNIQEYSNWWPVPVRVVDPEKNYIQFAPVFFIKIGWEVTYESSVNAVHCEYINGPLRGYGNWTFEQKENKVIISYRIKVLGNNLFYHFLASTFIFKIKHIHDIKKIIRSIPQL